MANPTLSSSTPNSPLVSLRGMELAIPSFRGAGVSRALMEMEKPLPPLPLRPRKPSRYSPSESATMCSSSRRPADIYGHSFRSGRPDSDESSFSAATRAVRRESSGRSFTKRFGVVGMTPPASLSDATTRDDDSISIDRLPFCLEWREALRGSLSSDSSCESLQPLLMDRDTESDTNVTNTESLKHSSSCITGLALDRLYHERYILRNRDYTSPELVSSVTEPKAGVPQDCVRSPKGSYEDYTRHDSSSPVCYRSVRQEKYSPSLYDEHPQSPGFYCPYTNDHILSHSATSPAYRTRRSYDDYGSYDMQPSQPDMVRYKTPSVDSPFANWLATYTNISDTYLDSAIYNPSQQGCDMDPDSNTSNSKHSFSSAMAESRNSDKPLPPINSLHDIRRSKSRLLTEQDRLKRRACHEWSNEPHNPLRYDFTPFQDALNPTTTSTRTSARSSGVISTATADSLKGTTYTGSDSSRTVKQAQAVQIASGAVERVVRIKKSHDFGPHPRDTADAESDNSAAPRPTLKLLIDHPRNNSIASAITSPSTTTSPSVAWSRFMNSAFPRRRSSSRHTPQTPKEVPPELPARPVTHEPDRPTRSEVPAKARLSDVVRGKLRSNKTVSKAERKQEDLRRSGNAGPGEAAGPASSGWI